MPRITDEPSVRHRPIWFPAKRYGWGWGAPITWQGWGVVFAYALVMAADGFFLAGRHWVAFYLLALLASAGFVSACYIRGDPPRWRWGGIRVQFLEQRRPFPPATVVRSAPPLATAPEQP